MINTQRHQNQMKKIKLLLLIILPVIYVLLAIYHKSEIGYYHLFTTEPGYSYMFNGLNITQFSFPWMVEHPGTPLSVLAAIVIEVAHLFHRQETLVIDLFKNPEYYLNAIIAVLIALDCITIFLMGYFITKSSKNIIAGIFFQLTPFASFMVLSFSDIIMVEHLVLIFIMGLITVIFKYTQHINSNIKLVDRYLIWFSVLTGLICSTKVMYVATAIIPFVLLPGGKKKGLYVIFTMIAFSVFAFAIFNRWVYFRNWFFNNLIHSGQYGNGPANIIEKSSFIKNIKTIFIRKSVFSYAFFIIILATILYHFKIFKVKRNNDIHYRALLGISLCMIIMIIIAAKQFKYYYLFPALLLVVPGIYFILSVYSRPIVNFIPKFTLIPALAIFVFIAYKIEVKQLFYLHSYSISRKEEHLETMKFINKNFDKNQPTLLISDYYGAPYVEYGLFYGMAWCGGKMRTKYAPVLINLYPHKYFYHGWNNLFNYWNNSFPYIDLLKRYHQLVLYSGDNEMEKSLESKLHGMNRQIDLNYDTVYLNNKTGEKLYKVTYDSLSSKIIRQFTCGAEKLDLSKSCFISEQGLVFENGLTQSDEKARSGKYSSRLTDKCPYGFTSYISEVSEGEHYIFSVWRYKNNHDAGLVVTTSDPDVFYHLQTKSVQKEGEWEMLKFEFKVPESLNKKDLKIYCWNQNKVLPAYFDDLVIQRGN